MKVVLAKLLFLVSLFLITFYLWLGLSASPAQQSSYTKDAVNENGNDNQSDDPSNKEPAVQQVHITRSDGSALDLDLEVYLEGVVGSEMPASFELEALKAQAVAARTFAAKRSFQVDDTTASQVYHDETQLQQIWGEHYDAYHEKIVQAIRETKDEVITYQGELITAAFFSSSNGYTNNSEDYWKDALPYLRSVESKSDVEEDGNEQSITFQEQAFADALGFKNPVTAISKPERFENGYVKSVTIDGIVFTGRELREKLKLRSNAFEIHVEDDSITFTTHGYGHGIGMSQYGAQRMAQQGSDYKAILEHYYTDTEITQIHV